jgi:hypothetical protein
LSSGGYKPGNDRRVKLNGTGEEVVISRRVVLGIDVGMFHIQVAIRTASTPVLSKYYRYFA